MLRFATCHLRKVRQTRAALRCRRIQKITEFKTKLMLQRYEELPDDVAKLMEQQRAVEVTVKNLQTVLAEVKEDGSKLKTSMDILVGLIVEGRKLCRIQIEQINLLEACVKVQHDFYKASDTDLINAWSHLASLQKQLDTFRYNQDRLLNKYITEKPFED